MKCTEFRELLDEYIDGELEEVKKKKMDLHILSCEECRSEYEFMLEILDLAKEEVELPSNYHESLCNKLEEVGLKENNIETEKDFENNIEEIDELKNRRNSKKKDKRLLNKLIPIASMAAAVVLVVTSYSMMGRNFNDEMAFDDGIEIDSKEARVEEVGGAVQLRQKSGFMSIQDSEMGAPDLLKTAAIKREEKIIKSGSVNIKLESYDEKIESIEKYVSENNAYIENKQTYTNGKLKSGQITIRVPKANFEDSIKFIKSLGEIEYEQTYIKDITKEYYDTKLRLDNMIAQNDRYKKLLDKAESVEDLLKIEAEMSRLAVDIELLKGNLKSWDEKVAYSRLDISIEEVMSLEPIIEQRDQSLGKRIRDNFINRMNSLFENVENAIIFVTGNVVHIAFGLGLFGIAYLVIKNKIIKFKRRNKDEKNS